ncbi:MAG: ATP-dependent helicase HrpB [Verrucomicrobiota bacterium JB023]|nr:ATP-dependent helicase HrpB [Verrucomicrobiota bacterium JB023]
MLPVEEIKDDLLACFAGEEPARILLKAPTGSGKSTLVPKMILGGGGVEGLIVVVQPRRIAARMLAEYVAQLCGSRLGEEVGYVVRFENRMSERTRLVYVTDGVLQRWLAEDPELRKVGCVLFDEFHERRLSSDLALGRVLEIQDERRAESRRSSSGGGQPALHLAVMSATLEVAGLEEYLAPCVKLESGGRRYPVEVLYAGAAERKRNRFGRLEEEPVWERIARLLKQELPSLLDSQEAGQEPPRVLIFLPGAFEIRKTVELLERSSSTRSWEVMPLYSALPPQAQRAAVARGGRPRIIVSTNVAETSITIDGIKLVVDSGTARQSRFDVRRGIDTLTIQAVSRASAEQRAGRAGRTGPGRCLRLWSEADHGRRPAFELPEVHRVDLAESVLYLKAAGYDDIGSFRWLDQPAGDSLERAEKMLDRLGATGPAGISEKGRLMASFPLHPRLAGLLVGAGGKENCVSEACFAAAALQGEGVWAKSADRSQRERFVMEGDWSDFAAAWRAVKAAEEVRFRADSCRSLGIHGNQAREVMKAFKQLCGMASDRGMRIDRVDFERNDEGLARALLSAFGDQVGVRLSASTLACRLTGKRKGKLDEASVAKEGHLFLACEATEVEGKETVTHLKHCARVEAAWLEEFFPTLLRRDEGAEWDEGARRVSGKRRLVFDDLVVEEEETGDVSAELAGEILAEQVIAGKAPLKNWDASVEKWIARVNFLAETMPELEMPAIGEEERQFVVARICEGARSLREIRHLEVRPVLEDFLSGMQKASLESYAPTKVALANGINTRVNYSAEEEPWIGEKVQRLYGVKTTPALPGGQKLVVKILAPNQRPWQVTKDLEGFWESGFAQMKKDLAGRYPKHNWDPDGR